jgi:PBP1b-binding outer membrane lipoprotein LpoB
MKRILATTMLSAAAVLVLAGCTGEAQDTEYVGTAPPSTTPTQTSTPTPTPTPTETPAEPDNI